MSYPDVELNYWGNRFINAGLADAMTFEAFLTLSPALRERRIAQMDVVRHLQNSVDRLLPDACIHGDRLIDPMYHGLREHRRPSLYGRRQHV